MHYGPANQHCGWANDIRPKISNFLLFFPDSPTEETCRRLLNAQWLKLRGIMQGCAFWECHTMANYISGSYSLPPSKKSMLDQVGRDIHKF